MLTLYAREGWGSALVEAQLAWYGQPFRLEQVDDLFASAAARTALARVNPLAQIPTLVLENGEVLTESAAITLYLAESTGDPSLVPAVGEKSRPAFLRWLIFLVANLYPTFTYADDPARFVSVETARQPFRNAVDQYGKRLWGIVEAAAGTPWFLGQRFSALDIYVGVMSRWRPDRSWFAGNAPRLAAIAATVDVEPRLRAVWQRNFPGTNEHGS